MFNYASTILANGEKNPRSAFQYTHHTVLKDMFFWGEPDCSSKLQRRGMLLILSPLSLRAELCRRVSQQFILEVFIVATEKLFVSLKKLKTNKCIFLGSSFSFLPDTDISVQNSA